MLKRIILSLLLLNPLTKDPLIASEQIEISNEHKKNIRCSQTPEDMVVSIKAQLNSTDARGSIGIICSTLNETLPPQEFKKVVITYFPPIINHFKEFSERNASELEKCKSNYCGNINITSQIEARNSALMSFITDYTKELNATYLATRTFFYQKDISSSAAYNVTKELFRNADTLFERLTLLSEHALNTPFDEKLRTSYYEQLHQPEKRRELISKYDEVVAYRLAKK